jgi:endo-1,4-beta-xylanase
MQTRRHFMHCCSSALLAAGCLAVAPPDPNRASLGARAAAKGLVYGASAVKSTLADDVAYAAAFAAECGILATDWEAKWHILHPAPTAYDFTAANWLFDFAARRHLLFRAHTLVWHLDLPPWFQAQANSRNARQLLLTYVQTVVGHFRGKVISWDVVNEVINPADGRTDSLRDSPWLRLVGPDYIETAFRAAAQIDPRALLVYNEDSLEYDTPYADKKRGAVLDLLDRLSSKEVPVQALGIEAHLIAAGDPFSAAKLSRFLEDVCSMGLKILVTELDVSDRHLPAALPLRDQMVADEYARFLAPVLDNKNVAAVLTWGLSDRYSWLKKFVPRADGQPVRPLPLDADLKPKLAWEALARSFDHAPARNKHLNPL